MEASAYIRFILALLIVLGMILALTWVMKRLGVGQNQAGALGRKKRLKTIESTSIDSRHRMVLVRRDNVDHLIILSPGSAQVVETGIPVSAEDLAAADMSFTANFKTLLNSTSAPKDPAP